MPYLSYLNFDTVHQALKQAKQLHDEVLPKLVGRQSALGTSGVQLLYEVPQLVRDALALTTEAIGAVASPGLREEAHDQYACDEIEIDDEGVGTSEAEGGVWVQAWVWVPDEDVAPTLDEDAGEG